jgi:hypothetical protein
VVTPLLKLVILQVAAKESLMKGMPFKLGPQEILLVLFIVALFFVAHQLSEWRKGR